MNDRKAHQIWIDVTVCACLPINGAGSAIGGFSSCCATERAIPHYTYPIWRLATAAVVVTVGQSIRAELIYIKAHTVNSDLSLRCTSAVSYSLHWSGVVMRARNCCNGSA